LERVVASPDFAASDRARRFLRYVVEETLAGRAERIKAFSVAVEVFGRDESFDPQNDPVVRIEAGRLRRAMEHYYLLSGRNDPVVIEVPKGGYVPVFLTRDIAPDTEAAAPFPEALPFPPAPSPSPMASSSRRSRQGSRGARRTISTPISARSAITSIAPPSRRKATAR
jgi:adenylate cyclase